MAWRQWIRRGLGRGRWTLVALVLVGWQVDSWLMRARRGEVLAAIRKSPPSAAQIEIGYDPDPQLTALKAIRWKAQRVFERDLRGRWRPTPWLPLASMVPQLGERLANRDAERRFIQMKDREQALYWLGRLESRESIAPICRLADDPEPRVRTRVAVALERIGVASPEALDAVDLLAQDPVKSVRFLAHWTGWRLDSTRWEDELAAFLSEVEDPRIRQWITGWLADRGAEASHWGAALERWLVDQKWGRGREHTVVALWRLQRDQETSRERLIEWSNHISRGWMLGGAKRRLKERVMKVFHQEPLDADAQWMRLLEDCLSQDSSEELR